jgi:hypothetical protein
MRTIQSLLAASMVLALAACGGKQADTAAAPAAPTAPSAPAAPTAPTAAPTSTVAAADKIGIAECDDFLAKYEVCVNDKLPADQRGTFAANMTQWRTAWKTAAENPASRDMMKTTCTQTHEQMKAAFKTYGCDL